jgi:chitosanase
MITSSRSRFAPALGALVGLSLGCAPHRSPPIGGQPVAHEAIHSDHAAASGPPADGCEFKDSEQFCACLRHTCGGDTIADRRGVYHTVYCGTCSETQVCVGKPSIGGGAAGSCSSIAGLAPAQKKIAEQLTSLWENDTTTLAYGYSENIKDGRGFTSGRAGFCTGTGDAIVVLTCYAQAHPGNRLQKYLPVLAALEDRFVKSGGKANQDSTAGLDGWIDEWAAAAADPEFRRCQDAVVDAVYYGAAMQHIAEKGFTAALTKAAIYDAQINMGDDNPRYGIKAVIARADRATGPIANPPTRDDESRWLGNFLRARAQVMFDDEKTWRSNMYRVANYEKLRRSGNLDLGGCIKTGASAAAMWPGRHFPTHPGPPATVGVCPQKLVRSGGPANPRAL